MKLYRIDTWTGIGWTSIGISVMAASRHLAVRTCRDTFSLTVALRAVRVLA